MGYLEEAEIELRALLDEGDCETVVAYVKNELLASYKSGIKVGAKEGVQPRRQRSGSMHVRKQAGTLRTDGRKDVR